MILQCVSVNSLFSVLDFNSGLTSNNHVDIWWNYVGLLAFQWQNSNCPDSEFQCIEQSIKAHV